MRIEANFDEVLDRLPDDVHVNDQFELTANVRVLGLRQDLIDVRRMGDVDPRYAEGELEVQLLISGGHFKKKGDQA